MNTVVSIEEQELLERIEQSNRQLEKLRRDRAAILVEIEELSGQVAIYEVLSSVREGLEKLHELDADQLFWADKYSSDDEAVNHIEKLRAKSEAFIKSTGGAQEKKQKIEKDIQHAFNVLRYLEEEHHLLKLREEEKKLEFVVEREMEPLPFRPMAMPWTTAGEDEKRFRKYASLALLYSILMWLIIPLWQLPIPARVEVIEIPERLAKLIKMEEPPPREEPQPTEEPKLADQEKKADNTEVTEVEKVKAREKAANTGLLAFKNNFADLIDDATEANLGAQAALTNQGSKADNTSRSLVTALATTGSGGINTSSLSRDVGGAGSNIGVVAFSRVTSEIGTAMENGRPLSDGPGESRTDEDIQIVFDRYKSVLYRIYNMELRKNPTLQGKMVLRITIQPDGKVSMCRVESTNLDSEALSVNIVARVKLFNFSPKPDAPAVTILYPIDFLPAF